MPVTVVLAEMIDSTLAVLFRVGFGYVPVKSPPAVPLGGKAVGICPKAAASVEAEPFAKLVIF